MENTDNKLVIGYVRVSTSRQASEGSSLESQVSCIKSLTQAKGLGEPKIYTDSGISGRSIDKRDKLQTVMDLVRKGKVSYVIVYSLSRFGRNTVDVIQMINEMNQYGVNFYSITESINTGSSIGKFYLSILAALANLESDLISDRVRKVLDYKKNEGMVYSPNLFGFKTKKIGTKEIVQKDAEGKMIIEPEEMDVVKTMFDLKDSGVSYCKIAKTLNEKGFKPKKSKKFNQSSVFYIVKRRDFYEPFIKGL